jgi:hypothetical protein
VICYLINRVSVLVLGIFLPFFNFFVAFLAAICVLLALSLPPGAVGIKLCILRANPARVARKGYALPNPCDTSASQLGPDAVGVE